MNQEWCEPYLLVYSDKGDRLEDVKETQAVVSWGQQLKITLWTVGGPINILGTTLSRYVFPLVIEKPSYVLPSLPQFLAQFFLLALLADLGLSTSRKRGRGRRGICAIPSTPCTTR